MVCTPWYIDYMKTKREIEITFKNKKLDFKRFNQVLKNYLKLEKRLELKAFDVDLVCFIYGWAIMSPQRTVKAILATI